MFTIVISAGYEKNALFTTYEFPIDRISLEWWKAEIYSTLTVPSNHNIYYAANLLQTK